jgi:hypothetical protein
VVAVLNDDAVADPSWLDVCEEALGDPSVAAVTPKVLLEGWYGQLLATGDAWYAPSDERPLGRQLTSVTHAGEELLDRLVGAGVHRLESARIEGGESRWRWTRPGRPYYVPLPGPDAGATVLINGSEQVTVDAVCRLVNNAGLFLRSDGYAGDHGLECPDDGRWDRARETFGATGTAMAARAEVLNRVGLFAEPFFAYYEDADWSWRARRHGLRVVYEPGTSVSHRRSVTSVRTLGDRVRILGERNRLLTLVRNAPAGVLSRQVWRRVADGPDHGIRRGMLAQLPWALGTRAALARASTVGTEEVWRRWAGVDVTWDDGPCAPGAADRG